MGNLANNNNNYMLQAMAIPIAWPVTNFTNGSNAQYNDDHQLEKQIFLCREENVILQITGLIKISKWCTQSGHAKYIHTWIYLS